MPSGAQQWPSCSFPPEAASHGLPRDQDPDRQALNTVLREKALKLGHSHIGVSPLPDDAYQHCLPCSQALQIPGECILCRCMSLRDLAALALLRALQPSKLSSLQGNGPFLRALAHRRRSVSLKIESFRHSSLSGRSLITALSSHGPPSSRRKRITILYHPHLKLPDDLLFWPPTGVFALLRAESQYRNVAGDRIGWGSTGLTEPWDVSKW